jgi:ABC-2 type transport system ATP-binding protein
VGTILELDGITKRYGSNLALDALSLTVRPGEMYGFVGPNGAGKSTAMRIMLGVTAADAGDVRWRNAPVTRAVTRTFGYMPEERGLYPTMRIHEQLVYIARLHGLPKQEARSESEALLDALGLAHRSKDRLDALSLGNQQRVQLAAALVHRPDVLVLDEPFSGLDPHGVDALAGLLEQRCDEGAAVIFSSHQLELVERLCRDVGILVKGRLIASGSVQSLRSSEGRVRYRLRVHGAQEGWISNVPSAQVLRSDGPDLQVELPESEDSQVLLGAAAQAGRVETFDIWRPTLAELFRDAVPA